MCLPPPINNVRCHVRFQGGHIPSPRIMAPSPWDIQGTRRPISWSLGNINFRLHGLHRGFFCILQICIKVLVPDMASFVGGLVMDSNKILPFLGTASEWCNGEGSSQQFSSSSNSNPRINQNLPRDHHPGYTPNLSTQRSTQTSINWKRKHL